MDDGESSGRCSPLHSSGVDASDRTSGCHATAASGIDSSEMEWTEEKHCMYLNYMEEKFVKELYNRNYRLFDSGSHPLRIENGLYPPGSHSDDLYSSQLTGRRRGAQEKSISKKSRPYKGFETDPYISSSNTCFSGGQTNITGGDEASSRSLQFPSTVGGCLQNPVGSSIEMSDQNFVDDYNDDKKARKTSGNRRTRNAANATL